MVPAVLWWIFYTACCMFFSGCRESAVLLEQWVHHEPDWGEQQRGAAHHVPLPVPHLQGALEPDHCRLGLQRPEDFHGDEQQAFWWAYLQLQGWASEVSACRQLTLVIEYRFPRTTLATVYRFPHTTLVTEYRLLHTALVTEYRFLHTTLVTEYRFPHMTLVTEYRFIHQAV